MVLLLIPDRTLLMALPLARARHQVPLVSLIPWSLQLQPRQMTVGFSVRLPVFLEMLPVPSCPRTPVLIHLPLYHLRTIVPLPPQPLLMGLLQILLFRHLLLLHLLHLLILKVAEVFSIPSPVCSVASPVRF